MTKKLQIGHPHYFCLYFALSSFTCIMNASSLKSQQHPVEFVCPLTKQLMKEPVLSKYGHHFERSAILQHIDSGHPFCPVSGTPLRSSDLIPNNTLQWKIKCWAEGNGLETSAQTQDGAEKDIATTRSISADYVAVPAPTPPTRFLCPLTRNLMNDPVMTKDGINFERDAIVKWLNSSPEGTCPVTTKPLSRNGLVSNSMLQREIEEWEERYGHVQSEKKVPSTRSSSSSSSFVKLSSSTMESSMIPSVPSDLYSTDSAKRIKYLRMNKKRLIDVLDNAINYSHKA
jgi:U-box domain